MGAVILGKLPSEVPLMTMVAVLALRVISTVKSFEPER